MRPIATDLSDFKELRERGFVDVDKTSWMYRMIAGEDMGKYFFISRPRRFGKSLMLLTFASIFRGESELFDGFVIAGTDYDWQRRLPRHSGKGYAEPYRAMSKPVWMIGLSFDGNTWHLVDAVANRLED